MAFPLIPGKTILHDWSLGDFDVLEVTSGKMPTAIDPAVPSHGASTMERCILFGSSAGSRHAIKPGTKGQP